MENRHAPRANQQSPTGAVRVALGERSYDIVIGNGILPGLGERLKGFGFSTSLAVVSNPTVFGLYGATAMASLEKAGFAPFPILIPDGEAYKDFFWSYHILTELLKAGLDRKSCIVALGGGVIGDITGFAAATYMRGIDFVQAPTTLLGQVDSSVGGKTGVNHYLGKNMIGAFHQPRLVWIDMDTLTTLPRRELLSGIAEIIKYGVIWDSGLFDFMELNRDAVLGLDPSALGYLISRSCAIKAEVVGRDERESGLRAILNYGHTIGHAVETETKYTRYLHGEAVAIGMCCEADLAVSMRLCPAADAERLRRLTESYGLPASVPAELSPDNLLDHMKHDKKTIGGSMAMILPERIGAVRIMKDVMSETIRRVLRP
jgi:3-dehydroquinate synthase